MNRFYYKYCIVPQCESTTIKTPNKLFIYVPNNKQRRKKWLILARRDDVHTLSTDSRMYFCEDHFDLPRDTENITQYRCLNKYDREKSDSLPSHFPGLPHSAAVGQQPSTSCSNTTDEDEFFEHRLKNEFTEPFEDRLMSDQNDNIDNAIQEPFGQPDGITCETKVEDIIDHFEVDEGLFSWQRTNKDVPCDTDTLYEEAAGSETEDAVWDVKREEYSCNECSGSIVGFRYTCVQCADCDICGSCEARGAHPLHYLLRVPWHRPHAEVQDVLHRIRRELLADTIGSIPPSTNVQVKEKPPCDFELLERDPLDVKQEPKSPEPTEVVTDTVRVLPIDPAKIFTNPMRTSTEPVRLFADPKETLTDPARISTEAMRIPMESVGIFSNSNIVKAVEILKPEPEPKLRLTEPTHIASEPPQKMKCIAFSPSNVSLQRSDAANQNTFVPQQIDIKRRIQKITLPLSIKKQKVTLENTERNKPKLVVERLIKPIDEVGRRIINKRPRIEDSHPLRKIAIRPVRTRHAGDTIEYRGCLWQRLTRP